MSFLAKHFKVSNLDSYKTGLCESQIWACNINTYFDTDAVVRRCSVKKRCSLKFHKIHRKTPVPETLANVLPCEFLWNFLRIPFL